MINFSVLMSVYKKEKASNLKTAIDSVLNQSLKPSEIILVVDGPIGKNLEDILKHYENCYELFKVIRLKKNVGLGAALNEGLKYCSYEYVARMDSDDISSFDRFEKQISYIYKNKDIDVVGGNITEFDDITGKEMSIRAVPNEMCDIKKMLKTRNPMNHVTVIFKKKSVLLSGGYMDCPYFEDYYLWSRMIKKGFVFSNINEELVKVRAGLSMSSRRGNFNYIKSIINFENKLYKLKLINLSEYIYNILLRSVVSILPNRLRYNFYQRRLRNEKN